MRIIPGFVALAPRGMVLHSQGRKHEWKTCFGGDGKRDNEFENVEFELPLIYLWRYNNHFI